MNTAPFPYQLKEPLYISGLILIILSFLFYLLPIFFPGMVEKSSLGLFFVNFFFTLAYFLFVVFSGTLKRGRNGVHHLVLFFILFLISAYSLNREMTIFEKSAPWFSSLLIAVCINYVAFIFFEKMPATLRHLLCFISGIAMMAFFYLAAYLVPIYVIGVLAGIVLGISLHTFVPLLFCIYTIVLIKRAALTDKRYWLSFVIGICATVASVITYVVIWNNNLSTINQTFRYASVTANDQLPSWVRIAQRLNKNEMTEKILKTDLVYAIPSESQRNWFFDLPSLNFEARVHDPLIMISTLFCGRIHVNEEDRIKILESIFNARHQAEERLWSGKDIITEHVSTTIDLWPALRTSYTEMEITLGHLPNKSSWTNTQEAIYSFHLPEGGVVTALSLWINGREEKGILTTKSKADSAYKTIVGVESRDPSVVHWQEGNRVSVRVFPVVEGESRKFKLGITAPIAFSDRLLTYNNISFDGPSFASAKEDIEIHAHDNLQIKRMDSGFTNNGNSLSKHGNSYVDNWSVSFAAPELSTDIFTYGSHSYKIKPISTQIETVDIKSVYLDINSAWSQEECNRILEIVKGKNVYVSTGNDEFEKLTVLNKDRIFDELLENNFSLFPFYKLPDRDSSLIISKSNPYSPVIDDLRKNSFISNTHQFFTKNEPVRLFHLGNNLSPYLKSLKEFRMLAYDEGDEEKLKSIISSNTFTRAVETDNEVAVYNAGISLERINSAGVSTAPDHLMRLFAYNHVLQRAGGSILADILDEEPLIAEAEEAYIVSPFSSLIVLETQKDYGRFGITASKNSLQNASSTSKGAVPEPHEWALIILVILLCAVIKFKPKLAFIKR